MYHKGGIIMSSLTRLHIYVIRLLSLLYTPVGTFATRRKKKEHIDIHMLNRH